MNSGSNFVSTRATSSVSSSYLAGYRTARAVCQIKREGTRLRWSDLASLVSHLVDSKIFATLLVEIYWHDSRSFRVCGVAEAQPSADMSVTNIADVSCQIPDWGSTATLKRIHTHTAVIYRNHWGVWYIDDSVARPMRVCCVVAFSLAIVAPLARHSSLRLNKR
jgi:hypothetical protein